MQELAKPTTDATWSMDTAGLAEAYERHRQAARSIGYDPASPASIESFGRRLVGRTFEGVCETAISMGADESLYDHERARSNKGRLGALVEYYHFGRKPNNDPRPDFPDAGVELKVTPFRTLRDGRCSAKERLVVTLIDYFAILDETFERSHFWLKAKLILLVCYEFEKEAEKTEYTIRYVQLFTPPEEDLPTIRQDWETIRAKVEEGLAHRIHCSETRYLEACPKGANAASLRAQPRSAIPAMQRAFAFKSSYMTYVLNRDIVPGAAAYERIVPAGTADRFEDVVLRRIEMQCGCSDIALFGKFGVDRRAKNAYATLVFRMLGIRSNQAEEFVKAGVVVKTIRLKRDGTPKESMSFPAFRFADVAAEEWDDAEIANLFRETRFLFVVFKADRGGSFILKGAKFWAMPFDDLEVRYRAVWQRTKDVILSGSPYRIDAKGRRRSNFPGASESPVGHVRPKARNAADVDRLPNGTSYTKQCFWLNADYVRRALGRTLTED